MEVLIQWRKNVDALLTELKSQQGKNLSLDEIDAYDERITKLRKSYNSYDANNWFLNKELEHRPIQEIQALLDKYIILIDEQEKATKNDQTEVQAKQEVVNVTEQQIEKEKESQQVQIEQTTNAIQNHKLEEKEIDTLINKYKQLRDTKNATIY